jgi:hypothetical protein
MLLSGPEVQAELYLNRPLGQDQGVHRRLDRRAGEPPVAY